MPEWEKIDFIATPPLVSPQRPSQLSLGITEADFAPETGTTPNDSPGTHSPVRTDSDDTIQPARKPSTAPTFTTDFTTDAAITAVTANLSRPKLRSSPTIQHSGATDQLTITRLAIHRQLRFLFICPLIYLLVWILPFVQHCLNYTDHYTAHPQF
jgi:G protein-coupled glucose receptor regulating Gpa2 C-term